jgi:TfoX/Sxy family transcriptional regulator of competence genes
MAYNEQLTNRLRELLQDIPDIEEKKMFSGMTFMVNGKMCIGCGNDEIMCRIDPALHDELAEQPGVRTMIMKGREMKGYLYVQEDAIKTKKQLSHWVNLCLDYNQHAKASKKKAKK